MKRLLFYLVALLFNCSVLLSQSSDVARNIYYLEKEYGDLFIESLYSIDETRTYSIIQIDKVSMLYNNNWLSPAAIVRMLKAEDKKYLVDEIINFLSSFDNTAESNSIADKLRNWCITKEQLDLVSDKMNVGRSKVLNLLAEVWSGYVNANTGETADRIVSGKDEEHEYYILIEIIAANKSKEMYKIYSKLFAQLAEGK